MVDLFNMVNQDLFGDSHAKKWTLAEVEQDILDAAMSLSEAMKQAAGIATAVMDSRKG
jgi:hypothetical protein